MTSELKIHNRLKNSGICRFEQYFEDEENIYIVLELCPNGSLQEMLNNRKRLEEIEVQFFATQMIKTLVFLED